MKAFPCCPYLMYLVIFAFAPEAVMVHVFRAKAATTRICSQVLHAIITAMTSIPSRSRQNCRQFVKKKIIAVATEIFVCLKKNIENWTWKCWFCWCYIYVCNRNRNCLLNKCMSHTYSKILYSPWTNPHNSIGPTACFVSHAFMSNISAEKSLRDKNAVM